LRSCPSAFLAFYRLVVYYAYGGDDFFIIADMPDSVTATAVSLVVNATGAVQLKTIVLITPEEVDTAVQKTVTYRPPGQ
jgi:uncharacterized protein with GYD domain